MLLLSVVGGCGTDERDPIYDETLKAVLKLENIAAEYLANLDLFGAAHYYTAIESNDGQRYYDWRPTWYEHAGPVEEQLLYAESTGRLSWSQLEELRHRCNSLEAQIAAHVTAQQERMYRDLTNRHEIVLEWIQNAEFDTSRKYLGWNGARNTLMASRFGRSHDVLGGAVVEGVWALSWWRDIADRMLFRADSHYGRLARKLDEEVEWALWTQFASQKEIDLGLMSAYVNECEWLLGDPFSTFQWNFGGKFPEEVYASISDDMDGPAPSMIRSGQQTRHQQMPPPRAPDFTVKAIMSSGDEARAIISLDNDRWRTKQQVVQVGDLIRLAGDAWIIVEIHQLNRSVVVENKGTRVSHVVVVDP